MQKLSSHWKKQLVVSEAETFNLLKVLESKIMLENPNAIVAVEVGRSNDANAMGRERETRRI